MANGTDEILEHRGTFYTLVFSPDDGGFYAELFDRQGEGLHVTDIKGSWLDAETAALDWIDANKG